MAVRYLEYLETTGSQYINTGFKPNNNTRLVIEISGLPITEESQLFGTRSSSSASDRFMFIVAGSPQGYRTDFYNNNVSFASSVNYSGRLKVDKNKNVTTINDTDSVTNTSGTFSSANSLYILASNTGGNAGGAVSVTFYSCQIYDNGTLVRDYRPAIDTSGVVCMYDEVNKEYVYNAGSGSFVAGTEIIVPDVQFGTLCRLPKKIGTPGGGGASEYAVTILDPNNMFAALIDESLYTITLNGTAIRGAGTIAVSPGSEVVIRNSGTWNWSVSVNGEVVKSASSTVNSYTYEIMSAVTFSVGGSYSSPQFTITTEGSGGTTPSEYAVTLTGSFNSTYGYVTINGIKYTSAQSVSVELNTSVVVYVRGVNSSASNMKITLNGTVVAQGSTSSLDASYTFKVTTNTLISFTIVEDWIGITTTAAITTE